MMALGIFLAEKITAENGNRSIDMTKATANFNDKPFSWEVCAARTKCFCVYSVDGSTFAASAYIKNLVECCRGADSQESQ